MSLTRSYLATLHIFIKLAATLTKLCHTKCDMFWAQ